MNHQFHNPQLMLAGTLARLSLDNFCDDDIIQMGSAADPFLEQYVYDTAAYYDLNGLINSGLSGGIIGKIKKAAKKVKKAVKKVHNKVTSATKKVTHAVVKAHTVPLKKSVAVAKKVTLKTSPKFLRKPLQKADKAISNVAKKAEKIAKGGLAPIRVMTGYESFQEGVDTTREAMRTAAQVTLPANVRDALAAFEDKHRPLLVKIATTVATVVASAFLGPGAVSLYAIAMESIQQLAVDLAVQKLADRYVAIKAKKDSQEIKRETEKLNAEMEQLKADYANQIMGIYGVTPQLIVQTLSPADQEKLQNGLMSQGENYLNTAEGAALIQPITEQLSAQIAALSSDNPLAAEAAANVAAQEAKPKSILPLLMAAGSLLIL